MSEREVGRDLDQKIAAKIFSHSLVGTVLPDLDDWPTVLRGDGLMYLEVCVCEDMRKEYAAQEADELRHEGGISPAFAKTRSQRWVHGHHRGCFRPIPHYSTDIAAAWEVVEKLRADGYTVAVTTSGHEAFAHVMVYRTKPYGDDDELRVMDKESCEGANADTAPHAIALAALAAVGALPTPQEDPNED